MPDYQEYSQQYGQGGIKAAILVNGGAAVALLSQATDLANAGLASSVRWALMIWAAGVLLGAVTWPLAFLSTRYVDKSDREPPPLKDRHLKTSNRYMHFGLAMVGISLICFAVGSLVLAWNFGVVEPPVGDHPSS